MNVTGRELTNYLSETVVLTKSIVRRKWAIRQLRRTKLALFSATCAFYLSNRTYSAFVRSCSTKVLKKQNRDSAETSRQFLLETVLVLWQNKPVSSRTPSHSIFNLQSKPSRIIIYAIPLALLSHAHGQYAMLWRGALGFFGFAVLAIFRSVFVTKDLGFSVLVVIAVCGFFVF